MIASLFSISFHRCDFPHPQRKMITLDIWASFFFAFLGHPSYLEVCVVSQP